MPKTSISTQQTTSVKIQETKKQLNKLGIKIPSADILVDFSLYCLNKTLYLDELYKEEHIKEIFKQFQVQRIQEE